MDGWACYPKIKLGRTLLSVLVCPERNLVHKYPYFPTCLPTALLPTSSSQNLHNISMHIAILGIFFLFFFLGRGGNDDGAIKLSPGCGNNLLSKKKFAVKLIVLAAVSSFATTTGGQGVIR